MGAAGTDTNTQACEVRDDRAPQAAPGDTQVPCLGEEGLTGVHGTMES